jgi:hypothetical protein
MNLGTMEAVVQRQSNDVSMETLRTRLNEVLSSDFEGDRVLALEELIARCATPLEEGESMSPEYEAFLTTLGRLHMLEETRGRLATLTSSL